MSLRVWLPLNGDLRNQGISDSTATLMGTGITWTAGKIGQAATFPNSCASCIHLPGLKLQILSWACWFKCTGEGSGSSQRILSEGRDTGSVGTNIWVSKAGTTLYWSAHKVTSSTAISLNTWYHVVLTCDGSKVHLYLNGEEKGTGTAYSEDSDYAQSNDKFVIGKMAYSYTATGSYFPFCGQVNDVRIYDHCLSTAEVKEIAQGLVLHYKLDNNGRGGRNLVRIGTGSFHNTDQLTTLTWSGWDSYNSLPLTDMDWNNRYGQQITYSCYVENIEQTAGTGSGIMLHVRYADGTYQQFGGGKNGTQGQYLAQGESGWLKLTVTIPDASTRSSPTTINRIEVSVRHNSSGGASTIKYKCPQAELGNKQTTWYWAPEDDEENTTIVEDSSGYGHTGTIINNPIPHNNSARYNVCTYIGTGSQQYINAPNLAFENMQQGTLNIWINRLSSDSTWRLYTYFANSYNWTGNSSDFIIIGSTGGQNITLDCCSNTYNFTPELNTWHMYTITWNLITHQALMYVDGELKSTKNSANIDTTYASKHNGHYFGNGYSGGIGDYLLSDARIYCTSLLDTDIKQLYNVGMKVDKSQNIHAFEFTEQDGATQFKHTGTVETAQVSDDLLFDKKVHIGKKSYPNILENTINVVTTKDSNVKKGTIASIPATQVQALAGKALRLIYDVCTDGDRSSTENGQTAYNYTRYGIHGAMPYTNGSGTTGTSYPFAGYLNYSGPAQHAIQTWTVPTGYQSYGDLSFSVQNFDKPASTNNSIWFIQNVRLEVVETTSNGFVTGNQIIER